MAHNRKLSWAMKNLDQPFSQSFVKDLPKFTSVKNAQLAAVNLFKRHNPAAYKSDRVTVSSQQVGDKTVKVFKKKTENESVNSTNENQFSDFVKLAKDKLRDQVTNFGKLSSMTSAQHLDKINTNSQSIQFAKEAFGQVDTNKITSATNRSTVTAVATVFDFLESLNT